MTDRITAVTLPSDRDIESSTPVGVPDAYVVLTSSHTQKLRLLKGLAWLSSDESLNCCSGIESLRSKEGWTSKLEVYQARWYVAVHWRTDWKDLPSRLRARYWDGYLKSVWLRKVYKAMLRRDMNRLAQDNA